MDREKNENGVLVSSDLGQNIREGQRPVVCRLCGHPKTDCVLELASMPYGDDYIPQEFLDQKQTIYPMALFLCQECGYVQLPYRGRPEFPKQQNVYNTSFTLGLSKHLQQLAEEIVCRADIQKGAFIVNFGSNDGVLLKYFQERGMSVLGVEDEEALVKKATEIGVKTLKGSFSKEAALRIKDQYGTAAVIIVGSAHFDFANVDNVTDVLVGLKELLRPNGLVIFEVGYLGDIIEKGVIDNLTHDHLSYFSLGALDRFLDKQGFILTDVQHLDTKGGCIRCFIGPKGTLANPSLAVHEWIARERLLGLNQPQIYRKFQTRMAAVKNELKSLCHGLRKQKKIIAGFGAAIGVTTLIYQFELADYLEYLLDDNPQKVGLYSPGFHVPVLSSKALNEKKPDYVMILAWRYAASIMKNHERYLKQGGHFIIPLPKVEIV